MSSLKQAIRNILPEYMTARFTVEQLSLLDIACNEAITDLYSRREAARINDDDTISIEGVERRIKLYRSAQRVIHEVLDQ